MIQSEKGGEKAPNLQQKESDSLLLVLTTSGQPQGPVQKDSLSKDMNFHGEEYEQQENEEESKADEKEKGENGETTIPSQGPGKGNEKEINKSFNSTYSLTGGDLKGESSDLKTEDPSLTTIIKVQLQTKANSWDKTKEEATTSLSKVGVQTTSTKDAFEERTEDKIDLKDTSEKGKEEVESMEDQLLSLLEKMAQKYEKSKQVT